MSRVIFKMTFKHPNFKTSSSKNMAHIDYIATRPGTDKTITEKDLQKELAKDIENNSSDDETYIQYIDQRPKSHGLFGQEGLENPDDIKNELSNVSSFVWRGIISLKEEDAANLGYMKKDQWQDMLRKKMPDVASEMGIPFSNLKWVGAVHMEKGHPHAHVVVWEKEKVKRTGVINKGALDRIRKTLTDEVFEEERFQLLQEKNVMRDYIHDLAKDDVGNVSRLLKEINATGSELRLLSPELNQEGVTPRLYNDEENYLATRILDLSHKLPGKGRANLKFMPEALKEEIGEISDYILKKPVMVASLEKNLKAVESLTRLYTGKEDAIQSAREKAYSDLRNRIGQLVLKSAIESMKENLFYVDRELSIKAVDFIQSLNNSVNLLPEQSKVLHQVAFSLVKSGLPEEQIFNTLKNYVQDEHLSIAEEDIKNMLFSINNHEIYNQDLNKGSSSKTIDQHLVSLKLSGFNETEAFEQVKKIVSSDSKILENMLKELEKKDILLYQNGIYKLTDSGSDELLQLKELDVAEKEILKALDFKDENNNLISLDLRSLIENKEIFTSLRDKDPDEFKLSKFDAKVRTEFGEENSLSLRELEDRIYERYTDERSNINEDKAEKEFGFLKYRIEKLALNGYVSFDKETKLYSFAEESDNHFEFNEENEEFQYTKEAIKALDISNKMEFTRYDANVTIDYIERSENGILKLEDLDKTLHREISNKTALSYYESFNSLFEGNKKEILDKYVSVDNDGIMRANEQGKWLGLGLRQVDKFIKEYGEVKIHELKKKGNNPEELKRLLKIEERANQYIKDKILIKAPESSEFTYTINPIYKDINNLLYQIYKNNGELDKNNLKDVLEKNVPNIEAEKQFKYLSWRLNNLKEQGYLDGQDEEFSLTQKGIDKKNDILVPQRTWLKKYLDYFKQLGLVSYDGENVSLSEKYYKYTKNIAEEKEKGIHRDSQIIRKDIYELIDKSQGNISVDKIKNNNIKIANGKFLNDDYREINTDYASMRALCGIKDSFSSVAKNLSTTLMMAGLSMDETKNILQTWNFHANNIEPEVLDQIIEKAQKTIEENNLWGKTTLISSKEWREMFELLGINEKDMPKWMYKGENWKAFQRNFGFSAINDLWKGIWKAFEQQRMQSEAQAEYMKKQLNKQQAASQSKEAIKEQSRKNKTNTLYRDDELEI